MALKHPLKHLNYSFRPNLGNKTPLIKLIIGQKFSKGEEAFSITFFHCEE